VFRVQPKKAVSIWRSMPAGSLQSRTRRAIARGPAVLLAAFLCADLIITPAPRADHVAYMASWLVLKNDKRAIFTAAAYAQRAADFLRELQPPDPA
jgi:antirestriction protein ArdC